MKEVRENENRKMMLCTSVNFTMLLFACLLYGMIDRANATIINNKPNDGGKNTLMYGIRCYCEQQCDNKKVEMTG